MCASVLLDGNICFRVCVCVWGGVFHPVSENETRKASLFDDDYEGQGCPSYIDRGEW